MNDNPFERATRTGRRLGIALFALLTGSFTAASSAQVLYQGFAASSGSEVTDCRPGLLGLISSLHRAQQTAMNDGKGERHRLEQFRSSLLPEWQNRDTLTRLCASDPIGRDALSQIDRLRWAEEHAVRYESVDLAPSRQRVLAIEQALRQQAEPTP